MPTPKTAAPVLSDEQVAQLKQKHGDVLQITVTDANDRVWTAWFRKFPDRRTVSQALSYAQTDVVKSAESLVVGCYLTGDNFSDAPLGVMLEASKYLETGLSVKSSDVKNC